MPNQTTPEALVELSGVHLKLPSDAGEVHVLRGVDLEIGRSETVGIIGPDRKSTR